MEHVILVDEAGTELGVSEKIAAHRDGGQLHLAFSILVHDGQGQWLLQRRASVKYHFARLWSNACCGHPRPGETVDTAAARRLGEEFGFTTTLRPVTTFIYRAEDAASGLTEHELLHVLVGQFDGTPRPNPEEIDEWAWVKPADLERDLRETPDRFSPWFRTIMQRSDTPTSGPVAGPAADRAS